MCMYPRASSAMGHSFFWSDYPRHDYALSPCSYSISLKLCCAWLSVLTLSSCLVRYPRFVFVCMRAVCIHTQMVGMVSLLLASKMYSTGPQVRVVSTCARILLLLLFLLSLCGKTERKEVRLLRYIRMRFPYPYIK